jgi:hypothetical protein
VGERIEQALSTVRGIDGATLVQRRRAKFLDMGQKGLA